jgi:putative Mn2+ efflux pump MntP
MGFIGFLLFATGLFVIILANWLVGLVVLGLGMWMMSASSRGKRIEAQNREMIDAIKELRREQNGGR